MNVKYLINRAIREYPDKTAVVYGGVRRTFRELDKRVNALANGLLQLGVKKRDRVGMLLVPVVCSSDETVHERGYGRDLDAAVGAQLLGLGP